MSLMLSHRYISQPIDICGFKGYTLLLKYGFDNLVDYFIEILLFDAAEATGNVSLDITCNNLALHKTWL